MLTRGQIESFSLICLNQISCQWGKYLVLVADGLNNNEQLKEEERFYRINSMWNVVFNYIPWDPNNCLTLDQVREICIKLMSELCITLVLEDLPETYLNVTRDFNPYDFNPLDFA